MGRGNLLSFAVVVAGGLLAVGCGGDDGNSDGQDATEGVSQGGGLLFSHTARSGSLRETADGDFDLVLERPAANVTVFTDRPARSADSESVSDFVRRWGERGFGDDPPNAALVLDQEPDEADTLVFELSDPSLDENTGSLSYRATRLEGEGTGALPEADAGEVSERFGDAHLFIDPGGATSQSLTLEVRQSQAGNTQLTFDSPWSVVLGGGDENIGYLSPDFGGGNVTPSAVTLNRSGDLEFSVAGGSGAITGTAKVPSGANATLQLGDGPKQSITNGNFSIGG